MAMAATSFNGVEPLEQIVNIPSTADPKWNLVQIGQGVSEKTFKDYTILYMYIIAQGQGQIIPRG